MNRCIFIIPYFGTPRNYYQLFLNSCEKNPDFDWMIVTDNRGKYKYPQNVYVQYFDFQTLRKEIQSLYDFKIRLEAPYKICDYRLAFGEIFSKYLKEYEFWGFCDEDLIFGDIGKFITDRILNSYDKILFRGHMTIMKNDDKCNNLYRIRKNGMPIDYQYAFSTDYSCHFDEHEMWEKIVASEGIKEYRKLVYADIDCDRFSFQMVNFMDGKGWQIFEYNNGKILRHYISPEGKNEADEWCYIHLQKRKMKVEIDQEAKRYLIVPNKFLKYEKELDRDIIIANSNRRFYLSRRVSRGKEIIRNIKQGALKVRLHSWRMSRI